MSNPAWFIIFWRGENPALASLDELSHRFDTTTDHYLPSGWDFILADTDEDTSDLVGESYLVTDTGLAIYSAWLHYTATGDIEIRHPDGFTYDLGRSIDTDDDTAPQWIMLG